MFKLCKIKCAPKKRPKEKPGQRDKGGVLGRLTSALSDSDKSRTSGWVGIGPGIHWSTWQSWQGAKKRARIDTFLCAETERMHL